MTIRTTKSQVTFRRPFVLAAFDELLPAGTYDVEIDEQLLGDVSFPVYRRVVALLHLHRAAERPGHRQILTIDPSELDEALERDQAEAAPTAVRAVETAMAEPKADTPPEKRGGRSESCGDDDTATVRW